VQVVSLLTEPFAVFRAAGRKSARWLKLIDGKILVLPRSCIDSERRAALFWVSPAAISRA